MNARSLAKRLEKLEVRFAPPKGPHFIILRSVKPGGEITRETAIRIGGYQGPLPAALERSELVQSG